MLSIATSILTEKNIVPSSTIEITLDDNFNSLVEYDMLLNIVDNRTVEADPIVLVLIIVGISIGVLILCSAIACWLCGTWI